MLYLKVTEAYKENNIFSPPKYTNFKHPGINLVIVTQTQRDE